MKNIALLAIAMSAAVTGSAMADTPAKTDTTAMTVKVSLSFMRSLPAVDFV
jgi:hypothetical protein